MCPQIAAAVARVALASLALTSLCSCVETSVYHDTRRQLELATRANQQKDLQVRVLESQLATLAQQLREAQLHSQQVQRDLHAHLEHLGVENATLAERLRRQAEDRPGPTTRGVDARARALEAKRCIDAVNERHAALLDRLKLMEKQLDALTSEARAAGVAPHKRKVDTEVVDPWGFGERK